MKRGGWREVREGATRRLGTDCPDSRRPSANRCLKGYRCMSTDVKQISFQAFCSKTREPFVVIAEQTEDLVSWIGADRPRSAHRTDSQAGNNRPPISGSFRMQVVAHWKCPVCGSGAKESGMSFWVCNSCHQYHCGGLANGKFNGNCGKCIFGVQDIRVQENFDVSASDLTNTTAAAQWRRS